MSSVRMWLQVLDLRGSPVGDSEVSALGWLPQLERLWLAAARVENRSPHAHYADDAETWHTELEHWETAVTDMHTHAHRDTHRHTHCSSTYVLMYFYHIYVRCRSFSGAGVLQV